MSATDTYWKWKNLQAQNVDGSPAGPPAQGPPEPDKPKPPPKIGQQWPVKAPKARRMGRPKRGPTAGMGLMGQHFAHQNAALGQANAAIADEMKSRKKIAGQQREMAFQASEADKQRAHERQMMQARMQPQQDSGVNHQKLDVLEGLLTGSRKKKVGGWDSVNERKYDILKRAFR